MAKNITVPAVRVAQGGKGREIFIASIKVKDLVNSDQFKTDYWDPREKESSNQGYQRKPTISRISKIANYATRGTEALFPSAILVNSRDKVKFEEGSFGTGHLTLMHPPFWIVDGQHRIAGLKHAIENLGAETWGEKELPAVILSNFNKIEEAMQFYVLNTEQKGVVADLAQRLISYQADKNPSERKRMIEEKKDWSIRALKVIDLLNENQESPWYKMVQLPNTEKQATNIAKQNSFLKSLQPLFKDGYFSSLKNLDINYQVLRDFWLALKERFPATFNSPKEYVIQKTPGLFSLHALAHAITLRGLPKYDLQTFRPIIKKVFADKDDYYWATDNESDGAALYGSMKGFRILSEEFINRLD